MKVGVLSDTHLKPGQFLPRPVWEVLEGVDLILHAGDSVASEVLSDLKSLAPVVAVRGNCDSWDLQYLPEQEVVEVGGVHIGLIHGNLGSGKTTPDRAFSTFAGEKVDIIVFGHSHAPHYERRQGILLFNPGSPTQKRREPLASMGLMKLGPAGIEARHIYFE